MTESPSRELRLAVVARLADPLIGLNHYIIESAAAYGVLPFTIDFQGFTRNFFQAYISPRELAQTTDFDFPVLCIYSMRGENSGNRAIGAAFDGDVLISVDVHLAWDGLEPIVDFESNVDAVEAALMSAFNIQLHPDGLIYGSYAFARTALVNTGNNWTATLTFKLVPTLPSHNLTTHFRSNNPCH